ncbi:hypothetical protein ABRZ24_19010 [Brenneria populi]|uniref:HEPN AbiJ-N-terminal domain-containing protein n=1 Tax=Brenneria populi TaxID=1505588 RepID=A0ABU6JVZ8_9GAMM|nr:hypothetical protein [Brenneria populi Li et al. 2015]
MPSFSQRMGIRPMQKAIQRESMDDELRISLWNITEILIWQQWNDDYDDYYGTVPESNERITHIIRGLWFNYFKEPVDTMPPFHFDYTTNELNAHQFIKKYLFSADWWQVYDFIEVLFLIIQDKEKVKKLIVAMNIALERENSAYRIVDGKVLETTDEKEITSIEDAIGHGTISVKAHLQRALELLSDRKQPDYRNSIKESISAVESVCNAISGDAKGTLGKGLKQIETAISLHPSLKNAFSSLYGYTSDSGGIRHAFIDGDVSPSFADAKFMLVACSAFCNFLWTKMAENGR